MSEPEERRLLTPEEYRAAQDSPEFIELKRRFRRFAFPMTVAFFSWYLLYVLLSTYAHDFMSTRVFGNVMNSVRATNAEKIAMLIVGLPIVSAGAAGAGAA